VNTVSKNQHLQGLADPVNSYPVCRGGQVPWWTSHVIE